MNFRNIKCGETSISSLNDLVPYLDGEFKDRKKEKMLCVGMTSDAIITMAENITEISEKGNAYFSSDDMFKKLKQSKSEAFVISHNHPNGFPLPSEDDIKLTKQIVKEAKKNKMLFIEHIICAKMKDGSFFHWSILKDTINKK